MLTPNEVAQYASMTLKQYGFGDHKVVWQKLKGRRLGQANPWEKQIELSINCLVSFATFRAILLHEIAHLIQFGRMGGTYQVNGRNNFHGKVFKECCKIVGINPKTHITI